MTDGRGREHVLLATLRFDPHYGGVENSLRELARLLSGDGHAVTIVAGDGAPPGAKRPPARSEAYGARVRRFRAFGGVLVPLSILVAALLLWRLRRRDPPTRIVARHHYLVCALWLAGYREVTYVVPTVVASVDRTVREVRDARGQRGPTTGLSHALQRFALRRAARVVTLSGLIADQVAREGIARDRVLVCPPGVQRERFAPVGDDRRAVLRAELGLPERGQIAVALGRFVAEKGFDLAVDAAKHLPTGWTLVLVGDGPDRERVAARVAATGSDAVLLHAPTRTPERYWQAADVAVLPSRFEPFGQVLLEAVASGATVAAFSRGAGVHTATEEVFEPTPGLVRYAHTLEPRALAAAIEAAALARADPLTARARDAFVRRYDWRRLADVALERATLRTRDDPTTVTGGEQRRG